MDTSQLNDSRWIRINNQWYEHKEDVDIYIDCVGGIGHVIDYDTGPGPSRYLCGMLDDKTLTRLVGHWPICDKCWNAYLAMRLAE